jgi:hypothetical protein
MTIASSLVDSDCFIGRERYSNKIIGSDDTRKQASASEPRNYSSHRRSDITENDICSMQKNL